jgi:hypothetical protein
LKPFTKSSKIALFLAGVAELADAADLKY